MSKYLPARPRSPVGRVLAVLFVLAFLDAYWPADHGHVAFWAPVPAATIHAMLTRTSSDDVRDPDIVELPSGRDMDQIE